MTADETYQACLLVSHDTHRDSRRCFALTASATLAVWLALPSRPTQASDPRRASARRQAEAGVRMAVRRCQRRRC